MAGPRLMRTAPADANSLAVGAPAQTITATGSGPAASLAIASRSIRPGTNRLSAPAAAYAAARCRAAGAGDEDVGARVDPGWDSKTVRGGTSGSEPFGLFGALEHGVSSRPVR